MIKKTVSAVEKDMKRNLNLLLVEDEILVRRYLAEFLRRRGYSVRIARSGQHALTIVKDFTPEVVVMDIRMPGKLDGISAAQEILKAQPTKSIIFLTAWADDPSFRRRVAHAKLEVTWLSKPLINPNKLLKTVESELRKVKLREKTGRLATDRS